MTGFLYSAVGFLVAIAILVTVHEFGHYWVARRLGVKVLRFSIGFGRPLWSRRFGADQTEWVVAALPLGGYVKMLDEREAPVPEAERNRAFNTQSLWTRSAIVLAGPAFNLLFAVLAYALVYAAGLSGTSAQVDFVVPNSPAARAGVQEGDLVLAVDGHAARSWEERRLYLFERALSQARVELVLRQPDGTEVRRVLDLSGVPPAAVAGGQLERALGMYPWMPRVEPVIAAVQPGPGADAGLQAGDRIVAINGQPIKWWRDVAGRVAPHPGQPLRVEIERARHPLSFTITPRTDQEAGVPIGRLGLQGPDSTERFPESRKVTVKLGALSALAAGTENTWLMSVMTLKMIYHMLRLDVSADNISGPLRIAEAAGDSARFGWNGFVMFLAVVSVSLGVLNLLPIPVLDGGHLLYHVAEAIKGRPLSEAAMIRGQQIGLVLLAALMMLALYNDITRLLHWPTLK